MSQAKGECGCGSERQQASGGARIVDRDVSLLIAAGASIAANSKPCLGRVVKDLLEVGIPVEQIQGAVHIGQTVKDKPYNFMKKEADQLTGTHLAQDLTEGACPLEASRNQGIDVRVPMLIAAGSAVATGCEPCLNSVIPKLIEARVHEADIRKAVEIGQGIKDRAATLIKEAADILTGTNLLGGAVVEECGADEKKEVGSCCI